MMHVAQCGTLRFVQSEYIARHRQIHARAKRAARARYHYCANRIVVACAVERMHQFVGHFHRKRVELFRAIKGQGENAVSDLIFKRGVLHGVDRRGVMTKRGAMITSDSKESRQMCSFAKRVTLRINVDKSGI